MASTDAQGQPPPPQQQETSQPRPPSATTTAETKASTTIVPLDAAQRTIPIHPSLPSIRLPNIPNSTSLNPLTLTPFTAEDLQTHNYMALREQYTSPETARIARDEAVNEVKERLEENEWRTREVERDIEEKEKMREIERKVYMKKLGK